MTMAGADEIVADGRVLVMGRRIVGVLAAADPLPNSFKSAPQIDTGGTIFPGLIDLHNHFAYNLLTLWAPPETYHNRSKWARAGGYISNVSLPLRTLADYEVTSTALVRYVEAKALVGGTTTGQGIRTRVHGGSSMFQGSMRNAELPDNPDLPGAGTRVPNLWVTPENVASFKNSLNTHAAYFYHLAEGTDVGARTTYFDLKTNGLITPSLVGIHTLGLQVADRAEFGRRKAKAVWSPFSNLLLYGQTLALNEIDPATPLALGSDWSPTGSKNLLHELKVARWVADSQHFALPDSELVASVTSRAAQILGWGSHLGQIAPHFLADLVVIAGQTGDPFAGLVGARERDVRLVLIDGTARYGDPDLVAALGADKSSLEKVGVDGVSAVFDFEAGGPLGGLTLESAERRLRAAMADLPGFREQADEQRASLQAAGVEAEPFQVELDNEFIPDPNDPDADAVLLADWTRLAESVELDTLAVDDAAHWARLDAQKNLPDGLVNAIKTAYGH